MLNGTVTGKVIVLQELTSKGEFCGRFMLRISQRVKGEFKHGLVECWIPAGMQTSFNWMTTTKAEYVVICFDRVSRPSVWDYAEMEVITAVSVTRVERN